MSLAAAVFLASIPLLISNYAEKYRLEDRQQFFSEQNNEQGLPHFNLPVKETFDFIVVGAGTSGCVVTRRLSDAGFSVLVLEAGGDPPPLQDIPLTWHITKDLPEINFLYKTVPQKNAWREGGGVLGMSSGMMMGGSSSHNGMTYERGAPELYDRWAEETQDSSWSYKKLLKYFIKSEKYTGNNPVMTDDQHGREGLVTSDENEYSPGRDVFFKAAKELGYNIVDSNGPHVEGFSSTLLTRKNGRRESSYTAYIKPIEKTRKNLKIYRYSFVSKVIIENKKAIGVEYTRHGIPKLAFAAKEVILSAGVYVSPLILIKSGIGSEEQLKNANVEPISILPGVGENFQDHPVIDFAPIHVKPEYSWHIETNLTFDDVDDFIKHGKGPLASVYHGNTAAFLTSEAKKLKKENFPDLQLYYSFIGPEAGSVAMFIGMNDPTGRGSIRLNTSATSMADFNLPIIDVAFLNDEVDVDRFLEGIDFSLNLIENTTAFKEIDAKYSTIPYKHCTSHPFKSRDYWKCYIRHVSRCTWHGAGTVKMGHKNDPTAVVDSKLRVFGVENLRTVDASIMSWITNANTMAPTYVIAEKAADDIIKSYQSQAKFTETEKTEL